MNIRDRVALHATLNAATSALFPMISLAERRARLDGTGDILMLVADIRATADSITDRADDTNADTTAWLSVAAAELITETAATLRSVAFRVEACVFDSSTSTGDWQATADNARCEWCRLHGQRTLMSTMFPVN